MRLICSGYIDKDQKHVKCGALIQDHDKEVMLLLDACKQLMFHAEEEWGVDLCAFEGCKLAQRAIAFAEIPSDGGPCKSCEQKIKELK